MAKNPNAKDNLRPFPKGVSGNPAGRPRSLAKAIKDMPDEAQAQIYGVLHHAISLRNIAEAKAYIDKAVEDKDLGRYGVVFQLALRSLTGPTGWITLNDILDRLFGKPRLQLEAKAQESRTVIVISEAAKRAGEKWSTRADGSFGAHDKVVDVALNDPTARSGLVKALESGATPRPPINESDTVIRVDNQDQADKLLRIGELGV